jgi:preprotein translocase subunit Sec61beta
LIVMPITTPQQSAGVISYYDAPEHGPTINAKIFLILVAIFVILVIVFDHSALVS